MAASFKDVVDVVPLDDEEVEALLARRRNLVAKGPAGLGGGGGSGGGGGGGGVCGNC
jgi:uncharacterized membrane protein YgcG